MEKTVKFFYLTLYLHSLASNFSFFAFGFDLVVWVDYQFHLNRMYLLDGMNYIVYNRHIGFVNLGVRLLKGGLEMYQTSENWRPLTEVALELGVSPATLSNRVKQREVRSKKDPYDRRVTLVNMDDIRKLYPPRC